LFRRFIRLYATLGELPASLARTTTEQQPTFLMSQDNTYIASVTV
jgi:hypothetical protein